MLELWQSPLAGFLLTIGVFYGAQRLYQRFKWALLNPVLVSVLVLIAILEVFGFPYEKYREGGNYLTFFLAPSVVALGVLFYENFPLIKKYLGRVFLAVFAGSLSGLISVIGLTKALGGDRLLVVSLLPKSVTTPIAIGISEKMGGEPSLTAAVVIAVGIFGAVIGSSLLRWMRIQQPMAIGLALGAAAHGIGTARAVEEGEVQGALAGLALALNGLFTAFLAPWVYGLWA